MRKVLICLLIIGSASPALAADTPHNGGFIDIGQAFSDAVAPYINALVQAGIAALIGWVALKVKQRTGVEIDEGHRDALTRALQSEASSLIAKGEVKMDGVKVNVGSEALASAVQNLSKRVPDALNHFGLTPDVLAKRIVAAIPQTQAGAQIVAAAHDQQAPAS